MPKREDAETIELIREWPLTPAMTFGSTVRAKGILLEIRARLPVPMRKSLDVDGMSLRLTMPQTAKTAFRSLSAAITEAIEDMESLPIIPREIQDILTITTTERHRWLKDGRLPSSGVRTVRLAGRAKQITFYVFDPRVVEDLLDRGMVDTWREEDVIAAAEKRQQAVWKRKLARSQEKTSKSKSSENSDMEQSRLLGWAEFDRDGLLR